MEFRQTGDARADSLLKEIVKADQWFEKKGLEEVSPYDGVVEEWISSTAEHMLSVCAQNLYIPGVTANIEGAAYASQDPSNGPEVIPASMGRHLTAIAFGLCWRAMDIMPTNRIGAQTILSEADKYLRLATEARIKRGSEMSALGAKERTATDKKAPERKSKCEEAQRLYETVESMSLSNAARRVDVPLQTFLGWRKKNKHTTLKPWKKQFLDLSRDETAYAEQYGAKFDCIERRWFVFGPVPAELQSYLADKPVQG